jgi:hypothetical protein
MEAWLPASLASEEMKEEGRKEGRNEGRMGCDGKGWEGTARDGKEGRKEGRKESALGGPPITYRRFKALRLKGL